MLGRVLGGHSEQPRHKLVHSGQAQRLRVVARQLHTAKGIHHQLPEKTEDSKLE